MGETEEKKCIICNKPITYDTIYTIHRQCTKRLINSSLEWQAQQQPEAEEE